MRMREIAGLVGITERAVQRIVGDLVGGGYVGVTRNGRRNVYHVITTRPLRHALERHHSVSAILDLVALPKR
jgi:predicted transcriptional regulator